MQDLLNIPAGERELFFFYPGYRDCRRMSKFLTDNGPKLFSLFFSVIDFFFLKIIFWPIFFKLILILRRGIDLFSIFDEFLLLMCKIFIINYFNLVKHVNKFLISFINYFWISELYTKLISNL